MKSPFIFGFILLILLVIGILVGLPYAIQMIKSELLFPQFSWPTPNYFFNSPLPANPLLPTDQPKISTTTATMPNQVAVNISAVYRSFGSQQINLRTSYFSSGAAVNITGWRIKSLQKGETVIGNAVNLPQLDIVPSDIWLKSGDLVEIIVGPSPLAMNFRVNNCFGWLNNLYNLGYSLNYCPGGFNLSDLSGIDSACQDLILRSDYCRLPSEDILNKNSYQCRLWVEKNMNYNSCVANHKNDSNFYKGWKIYTGNGNQIFDSLHDVIELRDQSGVLIDKYSY